VVRSKTGLTKMLYLYSFYFNLSETGLNQLECLNLNGINTCAGIPVRTTNQPMRATLHEHIGVLI